MTSAPHVVFVLGGPGSGKGTQCSKLVEQFGVVHLSAGDLLRAERVSGSENGELISSYIKEGQIVPVEITVDLIKSAMAQHCSQGRNRFLIDGFPRNQNNLDGWNSIVGTEAEVKQCLFMTCPEKVMEKRLIDRGKSSGRTDDNEESIRKRFKVFLESTMPIVEHFRAAGKLTEVSGDQPVEKVFEETSRCIENVFGKRI